MWIFTTEGFVSAVQKPGDTDLTIRSRDRASLATLAQITGHNINASQGTDYPYRVEVSREQFSHWLAQHVTNLDYANFKSAVGRQRGRSFAHPLMDVWSAMHAVTDLP